MDSLVFVGFQTKAATKTLRAKKTMSVRKTVDANLIQAVPPTEDVRQMPATYQVVLAMMTTIKVTILDTV